MFSRSGKNKQALCPFTKVIYFFDRKRKQAFWFFCLCLHGLSRLVVPDCCASFDNNFSLMRLEFNMIYKRYPEGLEDGKILFCSPLNFFRSLCDTSGLRLLSKTSRRKKFLSLSGPILAHTRKVGHTKTTKTRAPCQRMVGDS